MQHGVKCAPSAPIPFTAEVSLEVTEYEILQ